MFSYADGYPVLLNKCPINRGWSFTVSSSVVWGAFQLAFVLGTSEYPYLDELLKLLEPFPTGKVYADGYGAYASRIVQEKLIVRKKNTQKIERNHLTLRTRIKRFCRKTI